MINKNTFCSMLAVIILLVPLFSHAEQPSKNLSIEDVRRIVREEFRIRETELKNRELELERRESELKNKELSLPQSNAQTANPLPQYSDSKAVVAPGPLSLEVSGYGDMQAKFYDRAEGIDQPEGARGQSKTVFDTERFVLEIEGKHEPSAIEVEAEIEFEHGGTGVSQEIEFDEFGEFETEVEKGGEVIIEELYLQKDFGYGLSGKLGRFYTATGTLSYYYRPTDYLGVRRAEVEEVMLPGQWDEIGISLQGELDFGSLTLQLVNGLDSSGFSAEGWISGGHQSRFEGVRAEDLAVVGRIDVDSLYPGFLIGSSIYAGNTTGNRPKDDLDVDGTLVIGSVNYRYRGQALKTQGAFYIGHLSDAEEISERNSRLTNSLGVARTPVADGALGLWSEVGYNILPLFAVNEKHQLSPFVRFDYYDTYYDTRSTLADNGRFERSVYTAGLSYLYDDFLTLKLDWVHRDFGEDTIEAQNALEFGAGFVY